MVIETAGPEDLEDLMAFYQEMCRILDGEDFLPQGNKGGFPTREMVSGAIGEGGQFLVREDGRIAAAYFLSHQCEPAYRAAPWHVDAPPEQALVLHALRVLPQYGGRGWARQLVLHAARTARARGQRALRLDVLVGNEVPERLYRSLGFVYVDTVTICYPDIGAPMSFRLLELPLDRD